ncbi:tRNA methyltransferase [Candidatus Pacearchaeota archaeon]|nr:tRNA methyltransferase [Candidatus Pacearchaeota archaeon]|tara:strand:+ start:2445 stop:3422 length:978 start_codon:yes stop_codon:yes gene_type:complete
METRKWKYEMKPAFESRLRKLMPSQSDFDAFESIVHTGPESFIRCNTLKISPSDLLKKLEKKWTVKQPFPKHPEIMLITTDLGPGELGNAVEHILGYYYVQEISSMMSPLALDPQPGDLILDLFASPGSKTTQIAAKMENQGTIIANDLKIGRIKILSSNLERTGVTNTIVTRHDAISLCSRLASHNIKFDKVLVDAPCSGEGTLRSSPKTFLMWNPKVIKKFSRQQKKFIAFAFKCLKVGGTLVYSTCTHSPEENESVISFALKNFPVKIESLSLPLKCRPGITKWEKESYSSQTSKSCRIYPHDNNSEGFFLAKFTLLEEIEK